MPAYTSYSGEGTTRRQLAVAVGFLILAVALHFLPAERQQELASVLRGTLLRPFVSMQRNVSALRSRAADPAAIRRQLDSLVAVTTSQNLLREENLRLKRLLELKGRLQGTWTPATVMRPGTPGSESMFLLDVGSEKGISPYAPVIAAQGLIGRVVEVGQGRSVGIDWTHPDFRASAMDRDGIAEGIVVARRGAFQEDARMELSGTPFNSRLEDGKVVFTTGLGGTYPRGIPVGRIDGLADADAGWLKSYWLKPMVEPGNVTHVLVGIAADSAIDISYAFPPDSALTESELALREIAREDSLRALADSVGMLRLLLTATMPMRDSLMAALLNGTLVVPATQRPPAAATAPVRSGAPVTGRGGAPAAGAGPQRPPATRAFPPPAETIPVGGRATPPTVPDTGGAPRPDTVGARSRS